MAKTRLNRKGQEIPANANQRKAIGKRPTKKVRSEADHGTKKRPQTSDSNSRTRKPGRSTAATPTRNRPPARSR